MPTTARKRRAPALADSDDETEQTSAPTQSRRRSNRNDTPPASDYEEEEQGDRDDTGMEIDTPGNGEDTGTRQQMVKDLVRLALASEYSRTPIRRNDIFTKVLGRQGRQFKSVFDEAQMALRQTFGMEMVELPAKEKITLKERRAAQSQKSQVSASNGAAAASQHGTNSWILKSLLPAKFRIPEILMPPKVPTEELEAAYVGLYSFVIAVIMLNGGVLPEAKLERYLHRTNADVNTPVDKTDKLLQRMIKEGYLLRTKENQAGEEIVEYRVGPRGKMEIGEKGVENMVRNVYGSSEGADNEELEKKLERSLRVGAARRTREETEARDQSLGLGRARSRRGRNSGDDDGSDEN